MTRLFTTMFRYLYCGEPRFPLDIHREVSDLEKSDAMKTFIRTITGLAMSIPLFVTAFGCADLGAQPAGETRSVLVFTKTAGYRHASIEPGVAALRTLGNKHDFDVVHTEDAAVFTSDALDKVSVVIFLNTTGNILDSAQQRGLENFIRSGKGYVGIHSASDTEYDWPWYGQLVGAWFENHPAIQQATLDVVDSLHRSTQALRQIWTRTDEWYNFQNDPSETVDVLVTIDETSYNGGSMGTSHPITWCHEFDGGRSWYTGMGHTEESFSDSLFLDHVLGGIFWAAGILNAY